MIFDIENSLWKSNFSTLERAGKARKSNTGCLESRIMANFVRPFENWVAEGVASDNNDFNWQSKQTRNKYWKLEWTLKKFLAPLCQGKGAWHSII